MHYTNENAATSAKGHGAKNSLKATKLKHSYAMKTVFSTIHFWDRHSNSVQPISVIMLDIFT
jgi:hypothetical protein